MRSPAERARPGAGYDLSARAPVAGVTLLRVTVGIAVLAGHGWHKVADGVAHVVTGADWPLLRDTVALGFPAPAWFAAMAALAQFAGGGCLCAGWLTRPAALAVAGTMVTAVIYNVREGGPDAQLAALYALVTGAFVLIGAGPWSVDAWRSR